MSKIILSQVSPESAVQTEAKLGEDRWSWGPARYFYDPAFPGGTPKDGKINVIRHNRGGTVIARVDTVDEAIAAVEKHSGRKVQVTRPRTDRAEQRAEARIS